MRIGACIFNQNCGDWDRYEAEERGVAVPARPAKSDREIFNEELNIARIADETGFDSVWTVEHHFTPYTMVTNPLQYLTYLAAITKRVDFGTMVTVLPWHNPVRVAEDINMLDTFLGPNREIICGVGRGLGRREYEGFSIDQGEARDRFDESLQVLRMLLATGKCDFDGKYYKIKGLKLRPQPDRDLSPNLWCAGGTDETVGIIARNNVRPLVIPTASLGLSLESALKYARLRAAAGLPPTTTKLVLWAYVSHNAAEARRCAERYMVEYSDSALRHYELRGSHFAGIKGYEHYGAMQKALADDPTPFLRNYVDGHPWGTPDQVIKSAKATAEAFGCEEIMFLFKYGTMPQDVAEKNMQLFAKEVMPALQEFNPRPLEVKAAA